jgi:hypothetical protein
MVENPEVPVELEAKVRRAALGCPEERDRLGGVLKRSKPS